MPSTRRLRATFERVVPHRSHEEVGVELAFRPLRSHDGELLEDFAELGPDLTVEAVAGVGKVVRILRAARIAAPRDPLHLVGQVDAARDLLERALGTSLVLEVRPRSRLRFQAWTETGVEQVDHVAEVIETDDSYVVMRRGGRFPVRLERDRVVRRRTDVERWLEVVGVERA